VGRKLGEHQHGWYTPGAGGGDGTLTRNDERPLSGGYGTRDNRGEVGATQSCSKGGKALLVFGWVVLLFRARGACPVVLYGARAGRRRLSRDVELDLDIRSSAHYRQEFLLEPGQVICAGQTLSYNRFLKLVMSTYREWAPPKRV
jgi:hypothetical protein